MARIPQYNRSVTPQNTPLGYIKDANDKNKLIKVHGECKKE